MHTDESPATLLDPQTGKILAQISLVDEPIEADKLVSASGRLQGFTILTNPDILWDAWFNQEVVLLTTEKSQQMIKIMIYPAEGENQGYFDFIPGTMRYFFERRPPYQTKPKIQTRRWLSLVQAILNL